MQLIRLEDLLDQLRVPGQPISIALKPGWLSRHIQGDLVESVEIVVTGLEPESLAVKMRTRSEIIGSPALARP